MLLEDSKKLQAEKANQLNKEDFKAFQERKKRLKEDIGIDLDAKPKKRAGRPKGSTTKKGAK